MTELEAINEMLLSVQEAPINTLDGVLPMEALVARSCLTAVSREVQQRGWRFNTDLNVTLTKDNDDNITVGTAVHAVTFDPSSHPYNVVPVLLGRRVYDRYNQTYVIECALKAKEVIRIEEWDSLPEVAKTYITKRAAREFAAKLRGAELVREAGIEEIQAWVTFSDEQNANANPNMMDGRLGYLSLGRRHWRE